MSETYIVIDTQDKERSIGSYSSKNHAEEDRMHLMKAHFERTMGEMEKLAKSPIKRAKKTIKVNLDHPDADSDKVRFAEMQGKSFVTIRVDNKAHFEYNKLKLSISPDNPRYIIKTVEHRDSRRYS